MHFINSKTLLISLFQQNKDIIKIQPGKAVVGRNVHYLTNLSLRIELNKNTDVKTKYLC